MEKEWRTNLQEEFPFMRRGNIAEEQNLYRCYGFQCSGGWYLLLRECCEAIAARYSEDGIDMESIDFQPVQIKEKFGTLRFYYGYPDAPHKMAFDFLNSGVSMRFMPGNAEDDDATKKLRHDISQIVRKAEEKSKCTCEECGAEGVLRDDREFGIYRVQTLCDTCHENRIKGWKDSGR